MITPHIFVISALLSLGWGIYLIYTLQQYRLARAAPDRKDQIKVFREVVVAFCVWMICFVYVFRSMIVLAGFGEVIAGQIVFFMLLGTIVTGMIFVLVSLKLD